MGILHHIFLTKEIKKLHRQPKKRKKRKRKIPRQSLLGKLERIQG